jgi:hypothetical protein
MVTDRVDGEWSAVRANALATPDIVPVLRMVFGTRVRIGAARDDGLVPVEVGGWNERSLAGELAGFGAEVEVTEPATVRALLAGIGRELVTSYASPLAVPTHRRTR